MEARVKPAQDKKKLRRRGFRLHGVGGAEADGEPVWRHGFKINFCTRQFRSSATYSTFSDGQAIA
jgi:hypothetical protein